MAFYFFIWWHFLIMMMLIMIFSGIISFLFPRLPSLIILLVSGLIGFVYALFIDGEALAIYIVAINMVASFIPIILLKYVFYLQKKAENMERGY